MGGGNKKNIQITIRFRELYPGKLLAAKVGAKRLRRMRKLARFRRMLR